ncbi:hypothetical protein [Nonomuraea sp. B1E8]|uniref:hypothetical protein n=1 Tax=unclassified Nonomuraea TaxID=2593643 RepID=UPI00325E5119
MRAMGRRGDDWQARSRRLYPLSAHAVLTRPVGGAWPGGNPFMWEFVYWRALARDGLAARLLGLVVPIVCGALSAACRFVYDDLDLVVLAVLLVAGPGILLAPSYLASFLLRRPYWQPGVVSLMLLGFAVGFPLMFLAQALIDDLPHNSAAALLLDWATVQGLSIALGPVAAAVLWLPVGVVLFRRSRRKR